MKALNVKKGQILQSKGDVKSKFYIVKSGLLRSYTIDEKGKEHVFMFAPEGWIIADSAAPDQACDLFIDALEDSIVTVGEKDIDLPHDPAKLIKRISVLQKRVIMLMSSTAIERYEHFERTYPNIVQRVSQRLIASYLGITPEALSKVKGERARKNK